MDRLNFITYDKVTEILTRAGYDPDKDDDGSLRYPLPGLNYIQVSKGEGKTRNYAALKDGKPVIGGEDMVTELIAAKKEVTGTLRGIMSLKRPDSEASEKPTGNLLNLKAAADDKVGKKGGAK
jgi:hypothetical protein